MVVAVTVVVTTAPVVIFKPVFGFHVYVVPPVAVKVLLLPVHMALSLAVTPIVGNGLTVTVTLVLSMQPAAEVPTTV